MNFKDLLAGVFKIDLGEEITWQLLPLGLRSPIDPIEYISGKAPGSGKQAKPAVQQFLNELLAATKEVEDDKGYGAPSNNLHGEVGVA